MLQGLFRLFTAWIFWINSSSDFKTFADSRPSASNLQEFFLITSCTNLKTWLEPPEKHVKKILFQELFWLFTSWIICSGGLKSFADFWSSAANIYYFSHSRFEQLLKQNTLPISAFCSCRSLTIPFHVPSLCKAPQFPSGGFFNVKVKFRTL